MFVQVSVPRFMSSGFSLQECKATKYGLKPKYMSSHTLHTYCNSLQSNNVRMSHCPRLHKDAF